MLAAPQDRTARSGLARPAQSNARAEAQYRRGVAAVERNHWVEAEQAFAQAAALGPNDAVYWLNLANARVRLGDLDRAAQAARRAAAIDPNSELAVSIATQCLIASNQYAECVELIGRMDLAQVREPGLHFSLGDCLAALGRFQEAIGAYLGALQRKHDFVPAHIHLGNVFERLRMHEEARECFETALVLGGSVTELSCGKAYQALHACRWDLYAQDRAALQRVLDGGAYRVMPFQLLAMGSTRAEQRAAGQAYWNERAGTVQPMPPPGPRRPGPLRLGYVSNDLHQHATAYLIANLLELHDRARVSVHVYSFGADDGSAIRRRIIAAAGSGFVDASDVSDRALAERIRADDIDILVDLKGYTLGSRPRIFAYRAARIQVNYLGYPGTLGAPAFDYIIGDPVVTPLEHADGFSEKIAQLPDCYQPNDRTRPVGPRPTRADCGLPEQGFVFCSFNNAYKITAPVFDGWCRLLHAVPGSVLWLYEANPQARRSLDREAQARGIAPQRLIWAPHIEQSAHLGRLQLADLALDTHPVNSHTTASDALWAGVPLVTYAGDSFVDRVAASVLQAAGLRELVAADAGAAERLALGLAADRDRLAGLRARLVSGRASCALFDGTAHTRSLEALLARMMERVEQGQPAIALPAEPADRQ